MGYHYIYLNQIYFNNEGLCSYNVKRCFIIRYIFNHHIESMNFSYNGVPKELINLLAVHQNRNHCMLNCIWLSYIISCLSSHPFHKLSKCCLKNSLKLTVVKILNYLEYKFKKLEMGFTTQLTCWKMFLPQFNGFLF